jgi:hypothetical protein
MIYRKKLISIVRQYYALLVPFNNNNNNNKSVSIYLIIAMPMFESSVNDDMSEQIPAAFHQLEKKKSVNRL